MKSSSSKAPAYPIHRTPVRKISRSNAVLRTAAISLALVALIFGGLTLQMASGKDPTLGAGSTAASSASSGPSSTGGASAAPSVTVAPSPAQPTVVQQAPAPAPVQTSTS